MGNALRIVYFIAAIILIIRAGFLYEEGTFEEDELCGKILLSLIPFLNQIYILVVVGVYINKYKKKDV